MVSEETSAIQSIAALAHVDHRTVASYLSGKTVRTGNRERIEAAIRKMDKKKKETR